MRVLLFVRTRLFLPVRQGAGSHSTRSPSWQPCGQSGEPAAPVSPVESALSSETAPAHAPPSPVSPRSTIDKSQTRNINSGMSYGQDRPTWTSDVIFLFISRLFHMLNCHHFPPVCLVPYTYTLCQWWIKCFHNLTVLCPDAKCMSWLNNSHCNNYTIVKRLLTNNNTTTHQRKTTKHPDTDKQEREIVNNLMFH